MYWVHSLGHSGVWALQVFGHPNPQTYKTHMTQNDHVFCVCHGLGSQENIDPVLSTNWIMHIHCNGCKVKCLESFVIELKNVICGCIAYTNDP